MMREFLQKGIILGAGLMLSGCFLLPQEKTLSKNYFVDYGTAQTTFERVVPGYTTKKELDSLGFGPKGSPNLSVLNYIEIANNMSPLLVGNLPYGVQQCFEAKFECTGYVLKVEDISNKRYGNAALDLLAFERKTRTTGWTMEVTFLMVNDLVVYKAWHGTPQIEKYKKSINPLGPLQNSAGNYVPF